MDPSNIQKHCTWKKAVVSHTPEVLRYNVTDSESAGFAMYRTGKYKEADDAYVAALSSATNTIDALHVSFSADLICLVNLIEPGVCDFKNALPYMDALVSAAEQNGIRVRVIVENANMNGLENRVGLKILQDELAKRGISDLVELRFFDGRLHAKSALIDGQLLIVGSQNFRYSSFGKGGLLEFDAATTDLEAVKTYQKMFEYYWERAIPATDARWGSSGN
jgi:phosphatidylserine/phosphatidylglycerophosphate/cardiolipin synthase-like enzyme